MESSGGRLVVSRSPDGDRDRLRRYSVLVDGAEIGRVKRGESVTTDVSPGVHTLTIQIDGTKSEASFEVSGSDEVHFNLQPEGRARDGARDLVSGAPWVSITRADEP